MGRVPRECAQPDKRARIYASRVRLNSGGYDSSGAYWGFGQALYYVEQGGREAWLRAADRASAIKQFEESGE